MIINQLGGGTYLTSIEFFCFSTCTSSIWGLENGFKNSLKQIQGINLKIKIKPSKNI